MGDVREPMKERDAETPDESAPADRDAYLDDGLSGPPLTVMLFSCTEHGEEKLIQYYDSDHPPRCTRGDLMVRKAR
jgi:hypothetical protein